MSSVGFDDVGGVASKRSLKIYWLVDISTSMSGDKIATVNRAIKACIDPLKDAADDNHEAQMYVRALKFSDGAYWHTSETEIENFKWHDLDVNGWTDTGAALRLMAEELAVERMGQRALPPVIILMSDGGATDDYDGGINALLAQKWGTKAVRIAIAIGDDADIPALTKFCSNPKENPPLVATRASDLVRFIKWASVEVSKSVSNSVINNNNVSDANVHIPPPPQKQVTIGGNDQDWDDAIF
jgi:uncharacterized protein YegL